VKFTLTKKWEWSVFKIFTLTSSYIIHQSFLGRWPLNLENDRNVDFIAKTLLEWKYSLRAIKVKYRYCLYLMRRKITLTNNPYHKLNNHKERKLIWGRTKYIHIFLYFSLPPYFPVDKDHIGLEPPSWAGPLPFWISTRDNSSSSFLWTSGHRWNSRGPAAIFKLVISTQL